MNTFIAILGILSFLIFFYLLRFKASKKQTNRINRPKWSKYIPYKDKDNKTNSDDANDFALQMMIEKALDKDGARLFQDGDKASLRREVEASILQEIELAMINAGADKEVEEAKADLKS